MAEEWHLERHDEPKSKLQSLRKQKDARAKLVALQKAPKQQQVEELSEALLLFERLASKLPRVVHLRSQPAHVAIQCRLHPASGQHPVDLKRLELLDG